jgi:hypothetical protein
VYHSESRGCLAGLDIDVDLRERSLMQMTGDSRYTWNHGIRLGVTADQLSEAGCEVAEEDYYDDDGNTVMYDWFGSMTDPRRRQPERLSVVFAFDDPQSSQSA